MPRWKPYPDKAKVKIKKTVVHSTFETTDYVEVSTGEQWGPIVVRSKNAGIAEPHKYVAVPFSRAGIAKLINALRSALTRSNENEIKRRKSRARKARR